MVGGILAKALATEPVELFAFVILSNHVHMLIRAEPGQISRFMNYFSGMVGYRVGKLAGWRGKFWHRAYDAAPVLDEDAVIAKLEYMLSHGVKEGLVEHARDWPGLSALPELIDGVRREFAWDDRTALWECSRRKKPGLVAAKKYPITLSVLPAWKGFSVARRRVLAQAALEAGEARSRALREGKAALGVYAILAQDPRSEPMTTKRGPRPLFHATGLESAVAFVDSWTLVSSRYHDASKRWRDGFIAEFPPGMFRPPTACDWPQRAPALNDPQRRVPLAESADWAAIGPWPGRWQQSSAVSNIASVT